MPSPAVALIAGGTGLISTYMQSRSIDKATGAMTEASDKASNVLLTMFREGEEKKAPWYEAGKYGLEKLTGKRVHPEGLERPKREDFMTQGPPKTGDLPTGGTYSFPGEEVFDEEGYNKAVEEWESATQYEGGLLTEGPGEFIPEEDPGYKFGYEEFVEKPTLRMASATGRLGGGRTQKELTRYASDYASTKYDNFLDRWYQSLNPFFSMSGMGQVGAGQSAQNALTTGGQMGQNILTGGQARASGYIGKGNVYANLLGGAGQNVLDYAMLKKAGLFN